MVFCKLDKYDKYFVAFILVILVIFNISHCFAVETETIEGTTINGIAAVPNSNYYIASEGSVTYYPVEKGYTYTITLTYSAFTRASVYSSDVPSVNVPYELIYTFTSSNESETFNYMPIENGYIAINGSVSVIGIVTRQKVESMDGAVGDLVQNVGLNQLWSTFENGIDFIGVVVLVVFGLFLIVLLIKKLSKGKSEF